MDAHTLHLLEFDKVRELLAGYAATALGRELARELVPGRDVSQIRSELALLREMMTALDLNQAPPFGGLRDIRLVVRRASIGAMLTAEQLLDVAETLHCMGAIYRYRGRLASQLTGIIALLSGIDDLGSVAKTIGGCIDGRGHVLDSASHDLASVRHKLFELDERVKSEVKRLLRDPKLRDCLSYPNATVSGDHYVLPVAANHRGKVPGVIHRVSASGETLFVEPASIAAMSAERATLKAEEDREVKRVLRKLTAEVGRHAKPVLFALDVLARLDLLTARARYAHDFSLTVPEITTDGRLWLREARHPLLESLFRAEAKNHPTSNLRQVVPIEVRLGITFRLLIITGPNTGGKTVTLKTTGLLALMAQCGMAIPAADGSMVPVFSGVYADIGDEQSLEQSLSTFSSHIRRLSTILKSADSHSLILLDEMGAGTDPTEGAALGRAILDHLDQLGCCSIVTTHLGDLKTYAFHNENAENGAVEFDVETLQPTYRLHIGQFGMSNALRIARRLELPRAIVHQAHQYLRRRKGRSNDLLRLQQLREEAEKARSSALAAEHEATRQREQWETKQREFEANAEAEQKLREMRNSLQPNDRVHVQRFGTHGIVKRVNPLKQTITVSVGLGQWEVPYNEVFPESEST